jgi:hypothetical protein
MSPHYIYHKNSKGAKKAMKNRSPARIVELCVYVLIIIAAVIWLLTGGRLYNPPDLPPAITQTEMPETTAQPIIVPKGEIFPGQ